MFFPEVGEISAHAQPVYTRPSPPPISECLGTRLDVSLFHRVSGLSHGGCSEGRGRIRNKLFHLATVGVVMEWMCPTSSICSKTCDYLTTVWLIEAWPTLTMSLTTVWLVEAWPTQQCWPWIDFTGECSALADGENVQLCLTVYRKLAVSGFCFGEFCRCPPVNTAVIPLAVWTAYSQGQFSSEWLS